MPDSHLSIFQCSKDMLALRSFIFLYFAILFTHFNSQWADNSLHNIPLVTCPGDQGINFISESFLNVKAVAVGVKNIGKYVAEISCNSYFKKNEILVSEITKVNTQVVATAIFCAVKSYLHLLQLF